MSAVTLPFPTPPSGAESATAIETLCAAPETPDESSDAEWLLVCEGVGLVNIPLDAGFRHPSVAACRPSLTPGSLED